TVGSMIGSPEPVQDELFRESVSDTNHTTTGKNGDPGARDDNRSRCHIGGCWNVVGRLRHGGRNDLGGHDGSDGLYVIAVGDGSHVAISRGVGHSGWDG